MYRKIRKKFKRLEVNLKKRLDPSGIWRLVNRMRNKDRPDSIFVWIPKNAGSSIFRILHPHGLVRLKTLRQVHYRFPAKGLVSFGHMDYNALVNEGYIDRNFIDNAYKYCFSRNPYSRAVSLYYYLRRDNTVPRNASFLEFCRILEKGINPIGLYNQKGISLCNPQVRWIRGLDIDFCGRVESIKRDLMIVSNELGIDLNNVPHKNRTPHKHFSDYYCKRSADIIRRIYYRDFEKFGYSLSIEKHKRFKSDQPPLKHKLR